MTSGTWSQVMAPPFGSWPHGRALGRWALLCLLVTTAAACSAPPSHLTRVWLEGQSGTPLLGLSTEDGVIMQVRPEWQVGDRFELHFPVGNSYVRDWGRLDRRNDDLAIIRPLTSRLLEGRIATSLPEDHETIYLALRDRDDVQVMQSVELWRSGKFGDFVVCPDGEQPEEFARRWAGVGLYVNRGDCRLNATWLRIVKECRWEIVGLLTDLTVRHAEDPAVVGIGFVGIAELSRILPDQVGYFEHPILPPRPDFEFGVPLQPGDIVLPDEDGGEVVPTGRP